jgi:serine/threonine protein kinase
MTVDTTTARRRDDAAAVVVDGRYRLVDRLGGGGSADVWRAVDERLQRQVAVKLFRPGVTDTERERAEMQLMASLSYPGLVTVFDAGQDVGANGSPPRSYLVMELVVGPTLRGLLSAGPVPAPEAAAVGADVASSLAHIHALGIVHRDVKPANILLTQDDPEHPTTVRAKLADFGVARMLDSARLTAVGETVGTANYVSPEQIRGAPVGPASDVYSLGLVILEALTGRLVYPGTGVSAAVSRLHRAPSVPNGFGPVWTELLTAMVADNPADRPCAAAVADRLSSLAAAGQPAGQQTRSRPRRVRTAILAALVPASLLAALHRPPKEHSLPGKHKARTAQHGPPSRTGRG